MRSSSSGQPSRRRREAPNQPTPHSGGSGRALQRHLKVPPPSKKTSGRMKTVASPAGL
jgi:hypothetical protein